MTEHGAYRDDLDAAQARVDDLERELTDARKRNAELELLLPPEARQNTFRLELARANERADAALRELAVMNNDIRTIEELDKRLASTLTAARRRGVVSGLVMASAVGVPVVVGMLLYTGAVTVFVAAAIAFIVGNTTGTVLAKR